MSDDPSNAKIPGLRLVLGVLVVLLIGAGIAGVRHSVIDIPGKARASSSALPDLRIDLNAATADELRILPRIGRIMAQRIADDRHVNGPFKDLNDLMRVPGVGKITLDRLRPMVTVGGD